jgi:hypothetical protein
MRTQVAVYLYPDTKKWLKRYGKKFGMTQSEVVRALVEREQQVKWLQWALRAPDPARGTSKTMKPRRNALPPRFRKPPKP